MGKPESEEDGEVRVWTVGNVVELEEVHRPVRVPIQVLGKSRF